MIYDKTPKKITPGIKSIMIGEYEDDIDTFTLGLIDDEGNHFFVNFDEGDDNANVIMYNSDGELLSNNYFASNELMNILGNVNSKWSFIHKDLEDYLDEYRAEVNESNSDMTDVIFLIEKDGTDVFAYFPNETHHGMFKTCYSHIGQHSSCHPEYAKECKLAKESQYKDLEQELIGLGYNLNILKAKSIKENVSSINNDINEFAELLQNKVNNYYETTYPTNPKLHINMNQVNVKPGAKYTKIDIGHSGKFMIDNEDGLMYAIKGCN